jgi:hypothetical protein
MTSELLTDEGDNIIKGKKDKTIAGQALRVPGG